LRCTGRRLGRIGIQRRIVINLRGGFHTKKAARYGTDSRPQRDSYEPGSREYCASDKAQACAKFCASFSAGDRAKTLNCPASGPIQTISAIFQRTNNNAAYASYPTGYFSCTFDDSCLGLGKSLRGIGIDEVVKAATSLVGVIDAIVYFFLIFFGHRASFQRASDLTASELRVRKS